MTTRALPRQDTDSILRAGAEAIADLLSMSADITPSDPASMVAQSTMAAVVDGETMVFGLTTTDQSAVTLAKTLSPDNEATPDVAAPAESGRATIFAQFFTAVGDAIGQPLIEVDPEPFDAAWRIAIGESEIHVGMAAIPIGADAPATPSGSRLSSVRLDVCVELGRAQIPVKDLLALDAGGVIRLGRPVGEPVDLVVNGTVTARGEIVVVDGRLGLRITSLV